MTRFIEHPQPSPRQPIPLGANVLSRYVAAGHEHTTSEPTAGPDEAEAEAETAEAFSPEA